jgi:hypothetical protein
VTVYVDDMFRYPMGEFGRMKMSHMFAHTDDELHALAQSIGIARKWFQKDHYDVSMTMRAKAVGRGAVEVPIRVASVMMLSKRRGGILLPPALAHVQVYGHYTISRTR